MELTFFQSSLYEACEGRKERIRQYVKALPDSYFDVSESDALCEMIVAQFRFSDIPEFATGAIERGEPEFRQGSDTVSIAVYFPYKGDVSLFGLNAGSRPIPLPKFEMSNGALVKVYQLDRGRIATIDKLVDDEIRSVEKYLSLVREMTPKHNAELLAVAQEAFNRRAHEVSENKHAAEKLSQCKLKLHRRSDGTEKILVPVQRRTIITTREPTTAEPGYEYIGHTQYDDILRVISSMVRVMERSPSVFAQMGEESLRTILLVGLNATYEGQATGETFNCSGKTDILIRRNDRNVFIAECMMWSGPANLEKKLDDQLFRYATWRDAKLALIVFNRGVDFSHVIEAMKQTVKRHPQCINELNGSHESGARYLFRRHDDSARKFVLTAMAFNVPKGTEGK